MLRTSLTVICLGSLVLGISCTRPPASVSPAPSPITGKAYYVDNGSPTAADSNPGTAAEPWKTLARVGTATELKRGDAVYVKSIFRDRMTIKVNGDPAKPFAFEWAPPEPYAPGSARPIEKADVVPDVAYGHKDGLAMTFDVLKPKQNANGAGILCIESGAWYSNHETVEHCADVWQYMLSKGFTIFIVYHGSGTKYLLPEIVDDMHRAVRFIRANADRFGVDPQRLGAFGGSSAGHLTMMLATTADDGDPKNSDSLLRVSDRLAAVVAYFPPTDIRPWFQTNRWKDYMAFRFDPAIAGAFSPLLAVTPRTAPTLLIHGDKDVGVPLEHSEKIYAELQKNHVPSELIVIKGGGHGFVGMDSWNAMVARDAWFEKHLLPPKR